MLGSCKQPTLQGTVGAPCDIPPYTTLPPRLCDASKKLICDETTKTCKLAQQSDEGKACDPTGLITGTPVLCADDQVCVDFGPFGQRCHKPCAPLNPLSCSDNPALTCKTISFAPGSPSVCMDLACTTDNDCEFQDYVCSSSPGTQPVCRPPGPEGPLEFGAPCNTDPRQASTSGCKKGLICIPNNFQAIQGICSRDCSLSTTVCQPIIGVDGRSINTLCTASPLGFNACSIPCGPPSFLCPAGTSCTGGRCIP
jgi:hypothetical protein